MSVLIRYRHSGGQIIDDASPDDVAAVIRAAIAGAGAAGGVLGVDFAVRIGAHRIRVDDVVAYGPPSEDDLAQRDVERAQRALQRRLIEQQTSQLAVNGLGGVQLR